MYQWMLYVFPFPCFHSASFRKFKQPRRLHQCLVNRDAIMTCHSSSSANTPSSTGRRTADFQSTIWPDSRIQSLQLGFTEERYLIKRKVLMEDVRHQLGQQHEPLEQLELVDTIRQIGVAYHFELEIKDLLSSITSSKRESIRDIVENSLHGTFLLFRLLREYGINTSHFSYSHVVDAIARLFKDEKDCLKPYIEQDVKGLLSVYEASFLAMEGEDELDTAREFAIEQLSNLRRSLICDPLLAEQLDHALELPLHWRMPRLHERWFINLYERREHMIPTLLEFAKLDFNIVQCVYKKELQEESRWWSNLGLIGGDLHFIRDRLVEHYLWAMSVNFLPEFWRCRKVNTRTCCLITTIDDIYDVYGTLEELEIFTSAVNKWIIPTYEKIPGCMIKALTALFDTVNDIALTYFREKELNILSCLKRTWSDLCTAYLLEARWHYDGYVPTLDEYLENAWVSIASVCLLTTTYCLCEGLTIDNLEAYEFYPSVLRTSSVLSRLYNDLGTATREMERGDAPKSIQCYMKEKNISELVARDYIKGLISKYWKTLYRELFNASKLLEPFKSALVDLPRASQCFYQHGDGHGVQHLETKDRIVTLIVEPIPL